MLILLFKFGYFVVKFLGEDYVQKIFFKNFNFVISEIISYQTFRALYFTKTVVGIVWFCF